MKTIKEGHTMKAKHMPINLADWKGLHVVFKTSMFGKKIRGVVKSVGLMSFTTGSKAQARILSGKLEYVVDYDRVSMDTNLV